MNSLIKMLLAEQALGKALNRPGLASFQWPDPQTLDVPLRAFAEGKLDSLEQSYIAILEAPC